MEIANQPSLNKCHHLISIDFGGCTCLPFLIIKLISHFHSTLQGVIFATQTVDRQKRTMVHKKKNVITIQDVGIESALLSLEIVTGTTLWELTTIYWRQQWASAGLKCHATRGRCTD